MTITAATRGDRVKVAHSDVYPPDKLADWLRIFFGLKIREKPASDRESESVALFFFWCVLMVSVRALFLEFM